MHLKLSPNMDVVVYQSLIIYIVVLFYEVHTISVEITGSKVGLLGANGTEIQCSYTQEAIVTFFFVAIMAFNKNNSLLEQIATYTHGNIPTLTVPQGQYLKGRVTMPTITQSSKEAVMTFNQLMCIDDTFYQCKVSYLDVGGSQTPVSNILNISVQVPPSKPGSVSLVHTPADSSVTPTKHMDYSTSLPSTGVTLNGNNTVAASKIENQNTTMPFNHSTGHNITTPTPSLNNSFSNFTYNTTTFSTQQTTTEQVITDGDTLTVVCTGDVGNPPAEYFFQKIRNGHTQPVNYTASATSTIEISDNCSYYRTSNLTFQVKAEDNNAVIRCVVNSSMADPDMYVETAPLVVYFEVSMPTIRKYPNQSYYIVDEATSINLTCKSDGNPEPNYQWYKENNNELISTSANWTITDINVTNSGVYTCNVSNTFNGDTHKNAKHVQINIMNKAYTTRITLEHSSTLDDIPTTQSSTSCSSSCVGKKGEKSNGNFDDIPTTQSSSNCRSACVDKKEEKSKENLGLVVGIVGAVVAVIVVIIVIIARRRRKSKSPTFKNVSKSSDDSKPKPVTEPRTDDYETIPLGDDAPKTKSSNYGFEAEVINMHNAEYLKKDEEEKRKNESNTPPQPAVYAQVNEASKLKNKQKTEATDSIGNQEEDTYAETQEGIYDKAGDRRHKEKKNDEHYDSSNNLSKQNSNGDSKLAIQTSQVGSYVNQGFEKDNNRKVATVSPTVRSSSGSQNDEQTNPNRNSQSKKGNENIIGTEQTGISEDDSSHQTAL